MTQSSGDYVLRDATQDDFEAIGALLREAFASGDAGDQAEAERLIFEPERNHVIVHDDRIVANAGAVTRELTVPGAILPAAHVTAVSVEATHRRRGLLTWLMTHQLEHVPEPIAVLWASEGRIYQRYGYGLATRNAALRITSREVRMLPDAAPAEGTLRSAVPAEIHKELHEVYSRVRADRPGYSSRDESWWEYLTADPESRRRGMTSKRAVLHEDHDGTLSGYALWRVRQEWDDNGPRGEVHLLELVAATPAAYVALWRFLLSVDLTRSVHTWLTGVDEPIFHLVDEPRQLGAKTGDGLWLRIRDLPAALTARRYAAPVDVVFEVTDAQLPVNAGRWRLRVAAGGTLVTCSRSADEPDFACGIADLGAAYLGGTPLGALALAGRVREFRPGAVAATSTALSWPTTPTAIEVF